MTSAASSPGGPFHRCARRVVEDTGDAVDPIGLRRRPRIARPAILPPRPPLPPLSLPYPLHPPLRPTLPPPPPTRGIIGAMHVLPRPRDRFVTVDGLRLRYRDWGGNGRPLVALHGAVAHAHWWDPVAPHLARYLRVLALDWRGHGRSAGPVPPPTEARTSPPSSIGVIEGLRLEDVVVAGHSLGGHNAMAFAAWHPARLARLVVVDARPTSTSSASERSSAGRLGRRPSSRAWPPRSPASGSVPRRRPPHPRSCGPSPDAAGAAPVRPMALSLRPGVRANADAGRLLGSPGADRGPRRSSYGASTAGSSARTSPGAWPRNCPRGRSRRSRAPTIT